MTLRAVLHLLLHGLVPGAVAWLFFRARWRTAWIVMLATMLVDLDHLLAQPIFDPNRCSIGFHPFHRTPMIVIYALLVFLKPMRLIGVGLLIHMALDAMDCALMPRIS